MRKTESSAFTVGTFWVKYSFTRRRIRKKNKEILYKLRIIWKIASSVYKVNSFTICIKRKD